MTHELLMAKADAAIDSTDNIVRISQLQFKVRSLEQTIKRMKRIMVDADIRCECGMELEHLEELESGICVNCSRHLS